MSYAEIVSGKLVCDLYAGAGNFSFPMARVGARITAVECDKRLAGFGAENARRLQFTKEVEFVTSSVEKFLKKVRKEKPPELIVADPPRSGLGPVASMLPDAQRLILISCHQPSFVRDLVTLRNSGWRLHTILPFDMFAQTSYLEILSVFTRS